MSTLTICRYCEKPISECSHVVLHDALAKANEERETICGALGLHADTSIDGIEVAIGEFRQSHRDYASRGVEMVAMHEELAAARAERDQLRRSNQSHESQLVRISKVLGDKDARHSEDGTIAMLVESALSASRAAVAEMRAALAFVKAHQCSNTWCLGCYEAAASVLARHPAEAGKGEG